VERCRPIRFTALALVLLGVGWIACALCGCYMLAWPGRRGLSFELWQEMPYRIPETREYFNVLGISARVMGGLRAGHGSFMYTIHGLVVPYWLCVAIPISLSATILVRVRKARIVPRRGATAHE
jgi:hypothetical protein